MLRGASPSMDFLQLKSDHESTLKELYASREEVDSQRMLIMQLKAHIAKKDEELRRLELEKELRQEEIAEAKAYAKRSEEQVEKLKKQRAEQKDISKELAAAKKNEMSLQRKLTTAGEKLQALKSKSVSRNKKKERKLNRYSLPEVKVFSPTKLKQQVRQKSDTESPEKNRQNKLLAFVCQYCPIGSNLNFVDLFVSLWFVYLSFFLSMCVFVCVCVCVCH
jgi:predicted  nucleic acid-binding Zn-ribbon protein